MSKAYHVGFVFQISTCYGKLGGTWKCNLVNIKYDVRVVIPLPMVCFDLLTLLQLQLMLWAQILKKICLMSGP
jgi:hypothetical protein